MTVGVWRLSVDHQRRCWRCSQRYYLWLGSALTSGSLLVSLANQKPPCWDLHWNVTSHKTSVAASLSFTPCTTAIHWRIWDTIVADRGHLKYWRCVWFTIFWCGDAWWKRTALEAIAFHPNKKKKCTVHFKKWFISAPVFEEKVILESMWWCACSNAHKSPNDSGYVVSASRVQP